MSADPAIIEFVGRLTISEAPEIRETLLAGIDGCQDVVIDCSKASEIDLTFIQLLIAGRRTAATRGRSMLVSASFDSPLAEAARRAGFAAEEIITDPLSSH